MSNKTQTAVEWLISELQRRILIIESEPDGIVRTTMIDNFLVDIEESKIKEREQIRSAYIDGQDDILEHCKCKTEHHLNSLHYYQKKYK
jgi:hypothetical protein